MSMALPSVDLTGKGINATGKISLANVGISAGGVSSNPSTMNNPAHLYLMNDSGAGLALTFQQSGSSFNLPAGGWTVVELPLGETALTYIVLYALANPPVSTLLLTFYFPGENIPQSLTLGNSPIGGGVQTSSIQTLSNEGGAAGVLVIDMGPASPGQVVSIWNDHFTWSVVQTGTAHQVLKGNTSGNPLQLGQAADTTEVLGKLTVDDSAIIGSNGILAVAATDLPINVDTGKTLRFRINGGDIVTMDASFLKLISPLVLNIGGKKINDNAGNGLVDWSAGGVFLKGNPSSVNRFNYQANGANTDWTRAGEINGASVTVNGAKVVTHGLLVANVATAPDLILVEPTQSSAVWWIDTVTTTQFTIHTTSVWNFNWLAIKV